MIFVEEIERFMREDLPWEDVTTMPLPSMTVKARITAQEQGVVSGLEEAVAIYRYLEVHVSTYYSDGDTIGADEVLLSLEGDVKKILLGERLTLNFLGRMSGIASNVRECVVRAKRENPDIVIAGTRKTTPGFRKFEKKAIAAGGGDTHRLDLSDSVLIKDNHISVWGIEESLSMAKASAGFTRKVEVEVESLQECLTAAELGADIIMFDNLDPADIANCIEVMSSKGFREGCILEASGGINLENIDKYAVSGVDVLSLGSVTHDSKWMRYSMEVSLKSDKGFSKDISIEGKDEKR